MATREFTIPLSDIQVREDGSISLSRKAETAFMAFATSRSKDLGVEITAYHVAAAAMISAKMPEGQNDFDAALNWVMVHPATVQGQPIPCAELTKMCQTAHLPETAKRLAEAGRKIGISEGGNVIMAPYLRAQFDRRAKELTVEQGRPVTAYHLVAAAMMERENVQETLDWVIARQDLGNGDPIPVQDLQEAAVAERLPTLCGKSGKLPTIEVPGDKPEATPAVE
jgi:hypothetical protein